MSKQLNKSNRGFTIIEVLIVLAIAGLIMLVVFLAVPALQRNSRNTQRKSDAAHLAGLYSEWSSNHGGVSMTKANDAAGTAGPDLANESFAIMTKPAANAAVTTPYAAVAAPAVDTFYTFANATCNGSAAVTAGGSARSIIVVYYLEPVAVGTLQCVSAS